MKNLKNTVKLAGICALSLAMVSPSTSFASETEARRLLNQLYDQMDQISELTGQSKIERKIEKEISTETTVEEKIIKNNNDEEKKESPKEESYVTDLKQSFYNNDIIVKSIEEILEKYPKTIKGKEAKLVNLLIESHELKLQAADLIYSLTGEKLQVNPPRIPQEYTHLIRY